MKIQYLSILKQQYIQSPKRMGILLLFSFFCALAIMAPFINILFDYKPPIQDFSKHVISNGAVNDFDVASRISLFYKAFLGLLILSVGLFFTLTRLFRNNPSHQEDSKNLNALLAVTTIGIVAVAAGFFTINIEFTVYLLVLFGIFLVYNCLRGGLNHSFYATMWTAMAAFPFSVLAYQFILRKYQGIATKQYIIQETIAVPVEIRGLVYIALFTIFMVLAQLFLKFFCGKNDDDTIGMRKQENLFKATLPLLFILPVISICFEIFNIINVRSGRAINANGALIVAVTLLCLAFCFIRYRKYSNNATIINTENPLAKWHYPVLLINIVLLVAQPWRQMMPENEFFETANHGLSVDHFFRYGMLPIIETFDAHMLSYQMFAYLYGLFNGYEPWATFLYINYIMVAEWLIIYYLLKKLMGSSKALLVCLCLPVISVVGNQFIYCGVTALALLSVLRRGNTKDMYLFWITVALLCFFRLDLGFAATVAGGLSYFIFMLSCRQQRFKKFVLSGAVTSGSIVVLYVILCFVKGINPVTRLTDFLTAAMSNQNWAYESLGDKTHILFRMLYYVLPLLLFSLMVYTLLSFVIRQSVKDRITQSPVNFAALVFFVYFGVVFFANAPRGIVRHSYLFGNSEIIAGTILLAFLSYIYIKSRPYNFAAFLTVILCFFLMDSIKSQTAKKIKPSLLYSGINSGSFAEKFHNAASFNGTRVYPFNVAEVNLLKDITAKLLKPDETYFDFSSNNYYYALVEKKNPLYVNQSPLLLNGDASQEKALQVIKNNNIPMVLMPAGENIWRFVDGIPVDFKYYILSEYIYQNYTPLIELTTCTVYVLKDKKAEYENRLKQTNLINTGQFVAGFEDIPESAIQQHDIVLQKNGSKLKLKSNGADAFIYGLIDLLKVKGRVNENMPVTISINIDPETTGTVQVFYIMPTATEYKEETSQRFVLGADVRQLDVNLPALPKELRIDIDTPALTINNITFKNPENTNNAKPAQAAPPADYELGSIPRVWAEKSGTELFNKVGNLKKEVTGVTVIKDIKQGIKKPAYLYMEMESDTTHTISVSMLSGNTKKAGYNFVTKKGRHQYALRLSSNNAWWTADITRLTLTAARSVKMYKFAYITEDGSDIQEGTDSYMTLSNVNDQNWYGGVGLMFNVFLMDDTPQNRAMVKDRKIQFADGRIATIKDVRQTGNFLHVEIYENVIDFKETAAFPNTIKLIE